MDDRLLGLVDSLPVRRSCVNAGRDGPRCGFGPMAVDGRLITKAECAADVMEGGYIDPG